MSDSREPLSDRLRERIAALYAAHDVSGDTSEAGLPAAAQQRVARRMWQEAARLKRQRRRHRVVGGASLLLAAAAALLVVLRGPADPQPTAAVRNEPAAVPAPTCGLPRWSVGALDVDSSAALALGAFGNLQAQPQTQLSVQSSSACELELRLSSGTLAGELHKLHPARLVIRTAQGDVIVTGTRFSVHSDAELEVLLSSGVVDVRLPDAGTLRLTPGTRLHKRAGAARVERSALTDEDEQRLARWLQPPTPAAADSSHEAARSRRPAYPSSSAALMAAEAARRSQQWAAARDAYQAASQGRDSTAEVALLRWARFELDQSAPTASLRLLTEHRRRFAHGSLGAEAGWLAVQAQRALGQSAKARRAARQLIHRHPGSPQATAAAQLMEQP